MSLGRPWEPLRRALDDSPALVAIMSGPAHVFEYTNASYDEFSGRAAVGRPVREVFPELEDQEFFALLDQVYSSGESVRLEETPIRYLRPGATEPSEAWLTFTYSPLISDGVVTGVMCIAVDVTGVVLTRAQASETAELAIVLAGEAEVATGAASRLQAVTGDLTRALGVDDVLETVLAAGLEALEASSAHVALVDDASGMLQVQDLRMTTRPLVDVLALDADAPLAASVRTARPIFLGTPAEIRAAFPAPVVADNLAASGEEALVVVPLTAGDRVLGVLRFGIEKPSSPPAPVRSFMLSLANHCAVALERAQLAASAQHAWGQLQVSESRYRTLVEAMSLDVWRADPSGALVTDMPAWRELTGGTRDVRGDAWLADVHPEDQARVVSHWMRCVREQRFYDSEYRIRARDGWRRIRARGAPLRSSSGTDVIEWIGTTDDVTAEHLAVDRALALQRIAEALVAAATVADVEAVVLGLVREIVQARAVVVGLLHAETGAIPVRTAGYPADLGIDDADGRRLPLLTDAIRTGRARFIPDAPALREALTAIAGEARTADLFDSVTAAGDVSWCMLPLISRGTPSGGITLGFAGEHSFDAAERTFLLTIAANCAVALQRAQLFEEQRTVATVLQRALQPLVVEQPAFGSAWVEQRTAAGADVGGDWAEVLPLDGTRAAIVLGDVMGRGVRAARMMAETRAAVRTLACLDPDPGFVLEGLDRLFASQGLDEIVTLFYGVLGVDGKLRCISAGHLPPLVVPSVGTAHFLDVPPTPPLGVPTGARDVHDTAIASGDAIVLYSDGLVESRSRSVGDGLDALRAAGHGLVASDAAAHPRLLCARLIEHLLDGGESDDDVTLLALLLD